ncbi:MAG: hypothetical protein ACKVS8_02460 [Phycisphaerales bacterium]
MSNASTHPALASVPARAGGVSWRDRLRAVNPVELLFSPVYARDMAIVARRRGTYWVRGGYAAVLLFFVGLTFWGVYFTSQQLSGAARLQAFQQLAPGVALAMAWVQFLGLAFIAPNLAASALTDEKRNRTLATLATTPLTSGEIVFGLFASRWQQLLLLALLATPLLMVLRAFGGLEVEYIVSTSSIALSTAALAVSLTLLGSTFATRPSGATGFALGSLLAISIVPAMTVSLSEYLLGFTASAEVRLATALLSPPVSMTTVALSGARGPTIPTGMSLTAFWMLASGIYLALAVAVCGGAAVILRHVMLRVALHEAAPGADRVPRPRRAARPAAPKPGETAATAGASRPPAERLSRTVGDRPVLWREVRRKAVRMPAIMLTIVFIVATLGTAIIHWLVSDHHAITMGIVGVAVFIHVLLACGAAAGAVTDEVQGRTWGVLLTTALRPREILLGKAIGAARGLSAIPIYVLIVLAIKTVLGHFNPVGLVHVALIFAGVAALLCPLGAFFSLVCRKTSTATSLNMLVAAFLWLGLPLVVALVFLTGYVGSQWTWLGEFLTRAVVCVNPFQLLPQAVDGAYAQAGIASLRYRMGSGAPMGVWGFSLAVLVFAGLCAAGGAAALWLAERVFPRYGLRSS